MVPQISPSRLRHGTQVCYSYMGQSRINAMHYSHPAAYWVITLPKATFWCPQPNVMVPSHQYVSLMP